MSDASSVRRPRWIPLVLAALMAPILLIGVPALVASAPDLVRQAAATSLHGADLALFAAQPLALRIHIVSITAAAALGAVMMLSRKGHRFHRIAGWTWTALILIAAATPLWLAIIGWRLFPIHLTVPFVLLLLTLGVTAARRHDVTRHRRSMMWLYYGPVLGAGALTFLPGRLMWRLFFG